MRQAQETVWLGALWFDGSSQSASDAKCWFFAQRGTSPTCLEDSTAAVPKALTRLAKDTEGLQMFSSKAPYLAKLHSFLRWDPTPSRCSTGRRASSSSTASTRFFASWCWMTIRRFDDAQKVVDGFAELASIHADLELANAQWVSLLPLRESGHTQSSNRPSTCRICRRCSNSCRTGLPRKACNGGASA